MADRGKAGVGGVVLLGELAWVLFDRFSDVRDALQAAKDAGGGPKLMADLLTSPATHVIVTIFGLAMVVMAFWKPRRSPDDKDSSGGNQANPSGTGNATTFGDNSPASVTNVSGDLNIHTRGLSEEESRTLKAIWGAVSGRGEQYESTQLLQKYPFGYVMFDIDKKNHVTSYEQHLVDYDVDFSTVQARDLGAQIEVHFPRFINKETKRAAVFNGVAVTSRHLGAFGGQGISGPNGGLWAEGELVAFRNDGIVFLIGLKPMPFDFSKLIAATQKP